MSRTGSTRADHRGARGLTDLLALVADARVFDLSRPYEAGMPQSPNHPVYSHALPRRHGDSVREDGGSAASDMIIMGTHVGTHVDALGHVSQDGRLYGGADAATAQVGGQFVEHGIHTVPPMVGRGVLLDVPAALGIPICEPGHEITPAELEITVERQGTRLQSGDVALVRSGWGRLWDEGADVYVGHASGVPGVGQAGAQWLARAGVRAAGADSIAFERLAPNAGHSVLPAHRVLLVEQGVNIIETLALEDLAVASAYEFLFVCAPLPLVGATGAPVRPLAVVPT